MKIIDLNLLIYAVNQDVPHHEKARKWWENCLREKESIGLPWIVLLGFLRITTHPAIMPHPIIYRQASDTIDSWLAWEPTQIITTTNRHWDIVKQLITQTGTAANLTPISRYWPLQKTASCTPQTVTF